MAIPSYAPMVFQALAQERQRKTEEERLRKASTPNFLAALAGAVLGGLGGNTDKFGGEDWMQGALRGGLAGLGSSEAEGGVGVAKGALAGIGQGQSVRDYYTKQLAQQGIQSALESGDQAKIEQAGIKLFPEEVLKSKLQKSIDPIKWLQVAEPLTGTLEAEEALPGGVFEREGILPGVKYWKLRAQMNPFAAMFGGVQ